MKQTGATKSSGLDVLQNHQVACQSNRTCSYAANCELCGKKKGDITSNGKGCMCKLYRYCSEPDGVPRRAIQCQRRRKHFCGQTGKWHRQAERDAMRQRNCDNDQGAAPTSRPGSSWQGLWPTTRTPADSGDGSRCVTAPNVASGLKPRGCMWPRQVREIGMGHPLPECNDRHSRSHCTSPAIMRTPCTSPYCPKS